MQFDDNNRSGRTGVADREETNNYNSTTVQTKPRVSQADEARQLLDELAGLENRTRQPRPSTAQTIKNILLWPFNAIFSIFKFITGLFSKTDLRLFHEIRQFLKHPGHFFWFNRIAPEAAAQRFGTNTTDAMTNHVRRYGAHIAMTLLAVVVVLFGGFGNLATSLMSPYHVMPVEATQDINMTLVGDSREIYASAVMANSTAFTRRVQVKEAKAGQTLRTIAAAENISLQTLMYANQILDPDADITVGQKMIIPPTTGMLHITQPGDTIGKIADMYGVDPRIIIGYSFNNLQNADASTVLKALQEVMVPNGQMPQRDKLYMYTVRAGDTLKTVADKFGIRTDTILENNDVGESLKIGQQIRILPIDGVIYKVGAGDTLDGIAQYLSTSPENIINFKGNNVARGIKLQANTSLVVPGGVWPPPPPPPPPPPQATPVPTPVPVAKPGQNAPAQKSSSGQAVAPLPNRSNTGSTNNAPKSNAPAAPAKPAAPAQAVAPAKQQSSNPGGWAATTTGKMIWPHRGTITTYFGEPIWYGIHAGLDIAAGCGTPILAADGGTVVLSGWDGGYGNSVLLDHGNGLKTRYGHFVSRPPVGLGERVSKGQVIGYEGTTGASTGCHLHFEVVKGGTPVNPLNYLP